MSVPPVRESIAEGRRGRRFMLVLRVLLGVLVGVAVVVMLPDAHAHALYAAGSFKGSAIPEVAHFFESLKGTVLWVGITAIGFVVVVIGIMFVAGHSRAHDFAIKTLFGLLIFASAGGIVR